VSIATTLAWVKQTGKCPVCYKRAVRVTCGEEKCIRAWVGLKPKRVKR
jgi:hypothetical protein